MKIEHIKNLLETKRKRFMEQLQAVLNRGWAKWAKQSIELRTYRADQENQQKDGKGFYKLNEESIDTVCEDLTQDYQALDDRHSKEIVQLLEEFGDI